MRGLHAPQLAQLVVRERGQNKELIAPLAQWKPWCGRTGVSAAHKTFDFSFDRSYMSLEATALGLGIALESVMLASVRISGGALVPVFDDSHAVEVGAHHRVGPPQNAELPRIARFIAWIAREFGQMDRAQRYLRARCCLSVHRRRLVDPVGGLAP